MNNDQLSYDSSIKNALRNLVAGAALLISHAVASQAPFWPDANYDPSIPTLEAVVGHRPGDKITSPDDVLRYMDALAGAAPNRVQLVKYATSWEGRPLKYLVISSKKNIEDLAANQRRMQRLADPRRHSVAEREQLIDQTLPVSWLSYGVHGDEISSTDAALLSAYHLLASLDDSTTSKILERTIVVIDPSQNPDGRARFVAHFEQNLGLEPAVHQLAAEHRQQWPGARTNHYLFDMNRDWFAQTQPETQGRIKHYQKFFPVVHADVHEMGVNDSYYFPPPTPPFNPHISDRQKQNLILYGQGNAFAFDQFKFDYFTREVFDAHYAGYGDTWPAFHGAVAMTFEASSARGLIQQKDTGELVSYRSGVHRHFVASMATMLTTANHGKKLLEDLIEYREEALDGEQRYLFSGDTSLQKKLARKLESQGVEVHRLSEDARVCGESYQAGDFVVRAGQPAGNLVKTLLDADSPADEAFWQDKERKRAKGLPVDLYDVLAWSMPALYGLDVNVCRKEVGGLVRFEDPNPQTEPSRMLPDAGYGYLFVNDTSASMSFLAAVLRTDIAIYNVGGRFVVNDRDFDGGTLLVKANELSTRQRQVLQRLSNQYEVEFAPLNSSWTSAGVNFGSAQVQQIRAPKIAIAWDEPTDENAAGQTRFVIERLIGYPTTTIRTSHLGSKSLEYFDVLILPEGYGYVETLSSSGIDNIKDWTARGGVLITMGVATRFLINEKVGLLQSQLEASVEASSSEETIELGERADALLIDTEDEYLAVLAEGATKPDYVPGVIVKGQVDSAHWLAKGVNTHLYMVAEGRDIYTPLKQGSGTNVVRYSQESELLHGGYLWEENQRQLAFKPAVMVAEHGAGQVIGFVTNPTFRGYMDGFHVILSNAIFKAP